MMSSYKDIVKSSGLIAIVQLTKMFFGVLRDKFIAITLGAKGFGVMGLFQTYVEMVSTFSSLGLDQSGVRQIARNTEDTVLTAKCIWIFKRALLLMSCVTALLSIILAKYISISLFNSSEYTWGVCIVSVAILFNGISKGQVAVLNGLRELKSLAISQIIGTALGAVVTIILVFWFGMDGIPFYLFTIGITAFVCTWWYVRKLRILNIKPSKIEVKNELIILLKLGLGFSIAGIIASIMTYLSRVYLSHEFDIQVVGIYQASWTISNLYVGIILTAMGVDFMPRLMKVINEDCSVVKLMNEQMELGMLVSSVGVVGVLFFSPLILHLLYAADFAVGTDIIRWQILGVSMRVLAFPFGYAIMAKNKPFTYVFVQSIFYISDYLLLILFSQVFGFSGLGMNYAISYMLYILIVWGISFHLLKFRFSNLLIRIVIISYLFIIISWFISMMLSSWILYILASSILIVQIVWINNYLNKYMKLSVFLIVRKALKL